MNHVVLDPAGKSLVELIPEGIIAPPGQNGEEVELDDVSGDPVAGFHSAIADLVLGIPNWIVRSEVKCKLLDEGGKVAVPSRDDSRVVQVGGKPLLSATPEVRDDVQDAIIVVRIVLGALREVQIALGEEGLKFCRVRSIESVRITEIGSGGTSRRSRRTRRENIKCIAEGPKGVHKKCFLGVRGRRTTLTTLWVARSTTTGTSGTAGDRRDHHHRGLRGQDDLREDLPVDGLWDGHLWDGQELGTDGPVDRHHLHHHHRHLHRRQRLRFLLPRDEREWIRGEQENHREINEGFRHDNGRGVRNSPEPLRCPQEPR